MKIWMCLAAKSKQVCQFYRREVFGFFAGLIHMHFVLYCNLFSGAAVNVKLDEGQQTGHTSVQRDVGHQMPTLSDIAPGASKTEAV